MAINKYDQILSTSTDYAQALKAVDNIEKAVETIEWWGNVTNFPKFIESYNKLIERAVATTDARPPNSGNMKVAHKKLTEKLVGLDKRVIAASAKMGVAPPSKELIQMLKIHEEKKPDDEKDAKSKWTPTRIAKYSAAGVVTVLAARQLYGVGAKLPGIISTLFDSVPNATQETAETLKDAVEALKGASYTLGKVENEVRNLLQLPIIPPDKVQSQGASLMMGLAASSVLSSVLTNVIDTAIPSLKPVTAFASSAFVAGTACNHMVPNCTETVANKVREGWNAVEEFEKANPAGYNAIAAALFGAGTYNKDAIIGFFSSTSGFVARNAGYGAALWYLAKTIDAKYPGFIDSVRDKLPSPQDLSPTVMTALDKAHEIYKLNPKSSNWLGTTALVFSPELLHLTGSAAGATSSMFGYVGPLAGFAAFTYNTGVFDDAWNSVVDKYHTNRNFRDLVDAGYNGGYPIAKDAALWLNQTFNNPTEWLPEKLIKQNPEVLKTAQYSLWAGGAAWRISPWLFKSWAETAATAAGNAAAMAVTNAQPVITWIYNTLVVPAQLVSQHVTPTTADAIAAATAAQNIARIAAADAERSRYLNHRRWLTTSIFTLLPPAIQGAIHVAPIVTDAVKESCTNTNGYCHQGLEAAGKMWNWTTTGWDKGYLASGYNTVTSNPGTSTTSAGLFAGSFGWLKYRGWSNGAATAASTVISTIPGLANVAYHTSPAIQNGVDTISDGAGKVYNAVTSNPGTSTTSAGLFAGSFGWLKYRGWSNGAATAASTVISTIPGLANVAYHTSPAIQNGVDTISDGAGKAWTWTTNTVTDNPGISSVATGVVVARGARLTAPYWTPTLSHTIREMARTLGKYMVRIPQGALPHVIPNLRNVNGLLYQRVAQQYTRQYAQVVIPIVAGITATLATYGIFLRARA